MGAKTNSDENIISLKFYHEKLVEEYEKRYTDGRKTFDAEKAAGNIIAYCDGKAIETAINATINNDSGFNGMLAELFDANGIKKDIGFDCLLVSLSRMIQFIDKLVGQLCALNIGKGIITEVNTAKSMRRALNWLYVQSTSASDADYSDVERVRRFVRDRLISFKEIREGGLEKIEGLIYGADKKTKTEWITAYKKTTEAVLRNTFDCYDGVHKYFDIMKLVDRDAFEKELKRSNQLSNDYGRILLLAKCVLDILLRRFVAFAKINDINFPHGQFAYADLASTDLSGSNFISSDFSHSDLSNSVLRNSDLSVSNMTFCNAASADFSGCKLNSSNLVGSDFTNAIMTETQMNTVKFREPLLDGDKFASKLGAKDAGYFAERKKHLASAQNVDTTALMREFFGNFSIERQSFTAADGIKEEWKLSTCGKADAQVGFKNSLDGVCGLMEEKLRPAFDSYRYYLTPPELIRDRKEFAARNTACFKNATMTGALLPDADLSYVDFSSATLAEADLSGANLFYTDYTNSSLSGANLSKAKLYSVSLGGAECVGANLIGSVLLNCDMNGTNLKNALLIDAILVNENYGKAEEGEAAAESERKPYVYTIYDDNKPIYEAIDDTAFSKAYSLCDANLDGAAASNVVMSGLNLDRSSWRGAVLKKATLFNSIARWSIFADADFSYAILIGVSFHQAALGNVQMPKSRMYACDMSGVKLNRANFTGSRVEKVIFQNADLSNANFSRAVVNNCLFNDVNLSATNLSGAVFSNVIFENVNFSDCLGLATCRFYNCAFGSSCYKLEYQTGARHREDKSFMSIVQKGSRIKFFRESEGADKESNSDRYTSLSYYLSNTSKEE